MTTTTPEAVAALVPRDVAESWKARADNLKEDRDNFLDDLAVMMGKHVTNWPEPKRFKTAIVLLDKTLTALSAERDALAERVKVMGEALCFIGKWVERGLFCKTVSEKEALSVIANFPGMPWNSQRWDVDHKPYAAAYYKAFPKTAALKEKDNG